MLTEIANSLNEKYDDVGEDENYKVNMRNIVMAVQAKPAWNISLTCKVSSSPSSPSSSSTTTQLKRGKICNGAKYNDVISMSSGISILPLMCRVKKTLRFITFNLLLAVGAMASIIGLIWLAIQLKKSHDRRKRDIHKMANEIIELLQKHSVLSRKDSKVKPFIPLSHVRDALIPMADRKKKMSLWNRAIRFISENESRVEQDVQMINGEEVAIWKWVELTVDPIFNQVPPTDSTTTAAATITSATSQQNQPTTIKKSLSTSFSSASSSSAASFLPSSSSFLSKSFNAAATTTSYTAKATSACFKILNIINDDDGDGDDGNGDYQDIQDTDRGRHFNSYEKQLGKRNYLPPLLKDSILDTCGQYHGILHIGCDRVMEPGAVFVKCVSESAASQNYNTLHGWVYEGRLVSVKYVTPLAYKMIFPDVADYMVPLKSAAQRRRSLSRERNN
ncbi:hypothetical protein HELRODRAFT_114647 [Helobdella robusta]|uniref:Man1/Src1-like C-terminal domain-containing protein n=1 Tax=Helobdella robusta TaxID=6412 RepID=T1EG37_HELRO|nr:hypothetical protein HELRODRAFT_114647 [Helobdella robusta]ESN95451.1 hypothetical protein HELRODRAFT_114647 [Helobdella robusta]